PMLHHALKLALFVRVARAEEWQQGHAGGGGGARLAAGIGAVVLASLAKMVKAPTAVGPLMGDEPADRPFDRFFALRRAARVADTLAAAVGRAAVELALH